MKSAPTAYGMGVNSYLIYSNWIVSQAGVTSFSDQRSARTAQRNFADDERGLLRCSS